MVFALPGEPGLTQLAGDFKIHFHDRQGDFYCWLNTTMMENRKLLSTSDLDGFDKRKLPSPGFQVEAVLVDSDSSVVPRPPTETAGKNVTRNSGEKTSSQPGPAGDEAGNFRNSDKNSGSSEKDDVFSDSELDERGSKSRQGSAASEPRRNADKEIDGSDHDTTLDRGKNLTHETERLSLGGTGSVQSESRKDAGRVPSQDPEAPKSTGDISEFKAAMAADASVFTFGDEEDYESE